MRTARLELRERRDDDLALFADHFDHPSLADGPLRRHVLYRVGRGA